MFRAMADNSDNAIHHCTNVFSHVDSCKYSRFSLTWSRYRNCLHLCLFTEVIFIYRVIIISVHIRCDEKWEARWKLVCANFIPTLNAAARKHKFSIKRGLKAVARLTHCPSRVSIPVAPDTAQKYRLPDVLLGAKSMYSIEHIGRSCILITRAVLSHRRRKRALCRATFALFMPRFTDARALSQHAEIMSPMSSFRLFEIKRSILNIQLDGSPRAIHRYFSRKCLNQCRIQCARRARIMFTTSRSDQWSGGETRRNSLQYIDAYDASNVVAHVGVNMCVYISVYLFYTDRYLIYVYEWYILHRVSSFKQFIFYR